MFISEASSINVSSDRIFLKSSLSHVFLGKYSVAKYSDAFLKFDKFSTLEPNSSHLSRYLFSHINLILSFVRVTNSFDSVMLNSIGSSFVYCFLI